MREPILPFLTGVKWLIERRAGNETLAAYKSAAAKAEKNVPASAVRGGAVGSIPAANAVLPPV